MPSNVREGILGSGSNLYININDKGDDEIISNSSKPKDIFASKVIYSLKATLVVSFIFGRPMKSFVP